MKNVKKALLVVGILVSQKLSAQNVTINGTVTLEKQATHSFIQVVLKRIAPAPLTDTTILTGSNGSFAISITGGIYEISLKKAGYFSVYLGELNCFNNLTLPSKTLLERKSLIRVPYHFTSIQHAINDSFAGDTILLQPLTYFENIDTKGKRLLITSNFLFTQNNDDIKNTIIDGGNIKTVVVCSNFETANTKLSGFTIRNGNALGNYPDNFGGGIRCINGSPTLENLNIENNKAGYGGGGILLFNSWSVITNVRIIGNTANVDGGGIRITSSSPVIKNAIIARNTAQIGGGVTCNFFNNIGSPKIINSTIVYNTVTSSSSNDFNGGAGIKITGSNLSVENSIVAFNHGDYGVSFYNQGLADYPVLSFTAFFDNSLGNFYKCNPLNGPIITHNINQTPVDAFFNLFANPEFTDSDTDNFGLSQSSPCIDAGNNVLIDLEKDIDGFNRANNDNNLAEARINLGAKEVVSGSIPIFESTSKTICIGDSVSFQINSEGETFTWSTSENDDSSVFESGKTVTIDTIRSSTTFYVANSTYTQPSKKVSVNIIVVDKPEFTIESTVADSYQFKASPNTGISTYLWYVTGTNLTSTVAEPIINFLESGNYEICLKASNAGCEVTVCKFFDFIITGFEEEVENSEFDFFPNPAHQQFNIKNKNGNSFAFQIINSLGKVVYADQDRATYQLSMLDFANGVYILNIQFNDKKGKKIFKLMKN